MTAYASLDESRDAVANMQVDQLPVVRQFSEDQLVRAAINLGSERHADLITGLENVLKLRREHCLRLAVLGPFNQGKSTLLNAVLGATILPTGLAPTTGAAITVRHGPELQTQVEMMDGTLHKDRGTQLLERYCTLGSQPLDVGIYSVDVECPHRFLARGVEFIDLPGTNDCLARDAMVRQHLLSADVAVQVLNARQLLTRDERTFLEEDLLGRGISSVVFVINYMNLLNPAEQKAVWERAEQTVARYREALAFQEIQLYRVDALPALQARRDRDPDAEKASGLTDFLIALQRIVQTAAQQGPFLRQWRVEMVVEDLVRALHEEIQSTEAERSQFEKERIKADEALRSELLLARFRFDTASTNLRARLEEDRLLKRHGRALAKALENKDFEAWKRMFARIYRHEITAIEGAAGLACKARGRQSPAKLSLTFNGKPRVELPVAPVRENTSRPFVSGAAAGAAIGAAWPGASNKPLGIVIGAALGALLATAKASDDSDRGYRQAVDAHREAVREAYRTIANRHLRALSRCARTLITAYHRKYQRIFTARPTPKGQGEEQLEKRLERLRAQRQILRGRAN